MNSGNVGIVVAGDSKQSKDAYNAVIQNTITKKNLAKGLVVMGTARMHCLNVLAEGNEGPRLKTEEPGSHLLLECCDSKRKEMPFKQATGSDIVSVAAVL